MRAVWSRGRRGTRWACCRGTAEAMDVPKGGSAASPAAQLGQQLVAEGPGGAPVDLGTGGGTGQQRGKRGEVAAEPAHEPDPQLALGGLPERGGQTAVRH